MKARYLIGIIALSLAFGCTTVKRATPGKRDSWITSAIKELRGFKPRPDTEVVNIRQSRGGISFSVLNRQMIKDMKGNWAYFISHSSHQDIHEIEQDEDGNLIEVYSERIGDVSLAIDNKGNVYQNNAHPCSAIINMGIKGKNVKGLGDISIVLKSWEKRRDL